MLLHDALFYLYVNHDRNAMSWFVKFFIMNVNDFSPCFEISLEGLKRYKETPCRGRKGWLVLNLQDYCVYNIFELLEIQSQMLVI